MQEKRALILSCLIATLTGCSSPDPNLPGRVVYVTQDIKAGEMMKTAVLEEKTIRYAEIPTDALTSGKFAAGRIANSEIKAGQLVCQHHLSPSAGSQESDAEVKAAESKFKEPGEDAKQATESEK